MIRGSKQGSLYYIQYDSYVNCDSFTCPCDSLNGWLERRTSYYNVERPTENLSQNHVSVLS